MTWIQTYTGQPFDLVDPQPEMVHLEDIAHALAHLCRYTGHVVQHYSVAQHSALASRVAPDEVDLKFQALMHDAAEAYVGDVSKPMKMVLGPAMREVEDRVWRAVADRFRLPLELDPRVKEVDLRLLETERQQLLGTCERDWQLDVDPYAIRIIPWSAISARRAFITRFEKLERLR